MVESGGVKELEFVGAFPCIPGRGVGMKGLVDHMVFLPGTTR